MPRKKKLDEYDDYENRVDLRTPYSDVEVSGDRGVRVRAPFVDVEVSDRAGVRVRAPYVDIDIK